METETWVRHDIHVGKGTVLWDDCHACTGLSMFVEDLDEEGLIFLADKAEIMRDQFDHPETHNLSMAERRAITRLRIYARAVFRSGINEEVPR
jgi:hypothetical protein